MRYLYRLSVFLFFLSSFCDVQAADYYWVGGSGNWSDLSHWVTTSGGTASHIQVPTAGDNVFFDANSFNGNTDVVTINSDIFFKDMTWDQSIAGVTLEGDVNKKMNVYGQFVLSHDMNYNFMGNLIFLSSAAGFNKIEAHGFSLGRFVLFDSSQGKWTISSNIAVDSLVRLQDGIVAIEPAVELTSKFLKVDIEVEGSLLNDGHIIVTGNDFEYLFHQVKTVEIDLTNFVLGSGPASLLRITGDDATIFVDGIGVCDFSNIEFTNTSGVGKFEKAPEANVAISDFVFSSNGYVKGSLSIEVIHLASGKGYSWVPGYHYILEGIEAPGACNAPITLQSSSPGEAAFFATDILDVAVLNGGYLNIKDINISSGTFIANNSLDLGNSTGWTINERTGADLYWVGNGGAWNDPNHWAITSGGVGGACIPSSNDNVFFDANSFTATDQLVLLNIDDAYCKSMTWSDGIERPTLVGNGKKLHINGSLSLTTDMTIQEVGAIYFESNNNGNTILSSGHTLGGDLWFTGSGSWELLDDLDVYLTIGHSAGTWNTSGFDVSAAQYLSESDQPRLLQLGSSTMNFQQKPGRFLEFKAEGHLFEVEAGMSTIYFQKSGSISLKNVVPLQFNKVIFNRGGGIGTYSNSGNPHEFSRFSYVETNLWSRFSSDLILDTLHLNPGSQVSFDDYGSITINYLNSIGTCNNPISLTSRISDRPAVVNTDRANVDLAYTYVQDIHNGGAGSFAVSKGVDLGNNVGWDFDEWTTRTLYWVGDRGEWNDAQHWSLASGGVGGECMPTPNDDVVFDENSFTVSGQYVRGNSCYFRNMTWAAIDEAVTINWDRAYVYGSIYLSDKVNIERLSFIILQGDNKGNELDLLGKPIGDIQLIAGEGEWTFLSDVLLSGRLYFGGGYINLGDLNYDVDGIQISSSGSKFGVNMDQATLSVRGAYQYSAPISCNLSPDASIDPGTSTILLTNANTGLQLYNSLPDFYNLIATAPEGQVVIENNGANDASLVFNKLQFDGDAIINGRTTVDSLLLAPGKSYQLESGVTQTVNKYFQILGNNCNSIELTSSQTGFIADIQIDNFEVAGDFVQMRDIRINNPQSSYIGVHSTDIGNSNLGWIFDDIPDDRSEDQGFFGDDQVLCENSTITLEAYPFNANATFLWQDNSTDGTYEVDAAGDYWAEVTFDGGCSIVDTISILPQAEFAVVLGNDTTLCENEILILDVSVAGATYAWQDGTAEDRLTVTEAGQYSVDVNLEGCNVSDTIIVQYTEVSVDLGADKTICENDELSFDVTVPGASYMWQDNSTQPTYNINLTGTYYVEVSKDNCTATDTITIEVIALANVNLGNDTTICEGAMVELSTDIIADTYLWSNSATSAMTSLPSGKHHLEVTLDGCTATDTIEIAYKPYPTVDLGADTTLCVAESLRLDITGVGDSYIWSDGSDASIFEITDAGMIDVIVGLDGCMAYDTLNVVYNALPAIDLGNDTTVCEGVELVFELTIQNMTNAIWSDGTINNSLQASVSGQYYVHVYNGRCSISDTINLSFNPPPVFDLGSDMIQCHDEELDVDASVAGASYTWSDGSDLSTNTFNTEGDFWVDVTLDGCTVRDSISLSYVEIPAVSLGNDTTLCDGDVMGYDFSNLNLEFEWSDSSIDPTHTIAQPGTYWLQITDQNCSIRDSITLTYRTTPMVDLGQDTMLCRGEDLTLAVNTTMDEKIIWSDNTTGNTLLVEDSGSYSVEVDNDGCVGNDEIIITFNDPPSFDLGMDTLICEQEPLTLALGVSGATYLWQDGSTGSEYTVDRAGYYEVIVTQGGCSTIDQIAIDTRSCTLYRAYLPEVFSPNVDGINDTYRPGFSNNLEIVSYEMKVFDRWGNQLFYSEDPLIGWDGKYNQKPLNRGIYVYTIAVEYIDDRGPGSKLQRGEVILMK